MALPKVTNLIFAEFSQKKTDDIKEAVSELKISFSSTGVSQLEFSVLDPDFKMFQGHYFDIRRRVFYLIPGTPIGTDYEIAAVEIEGSAKKPDSVNVTCRVTACQLMKRDKGAANFGAIPASSFASQMAAKFGLKPFIEPSAAKEAIIRTQNETTDESTWDVLRRLSGELQYEFFEADGILYFASQQFILNNQIGRSLRWPTRESDQLAMYDFSLRRSDNNPTGVEFSTTLDRKNGVQFRPGMGVEFSGPLAAIGVRMMVTSVEWNEGSNEPIKLRASSLEDPEDLGVEV